MIATDYSTCRRPVECALILKLFCVALLECSALGVGYLAYTVGGKYPTVLIIILSARAEGE